MNSVHDVSMIWTVQTLLKAAIAHTTGSVNVRRFLCGIMRRHACHVSCFILFERFLFFFHFFCDRHFLLTITLLLRCVATVDDAVCV
jgi:hypothetical protein